MLLGTSNGIVTSTPVAVSSVTCQEKVCPGVEGSCAAVVTLLVLLALLARLVLLVPLVLLVALVLLVLLVL